MNPDNIGVPAAITYGEWVGFSDGEEHGLVAKFTEDVDPVEWSECLLAGLPANLETATGCDYSNALREALFQMGRKGHVLDTVLRKVQRVSLENGVVILPTEVDVD